jgi:hypothetical protein
VLKAFTAADFLVVRPLTTTGFVVGQVHEHATGAFVVLTGLPVVVAAGFKVDNLVAGFVVGEDTRGVVTTGFSVVAA